MGESTVIAKAITRIKRLGKLVGNGLGLDGSNYFFQIREDYEFFFAKYEQESYTLRTQRHD